MGFADELLPLGISLEDASGGETVSLTGLASAELSSGTSLGLAGWQVTADDLDKTWVAAPQDFVGVMDAIVNLHSASGQLLESEILRLEWIAKEEKEEGLKQALRPLEPALELRPLEPATELRPLDPEKVAILNKIGQGLLQNGDIASARPILKSAAEAGDARAALALGMTFDPVFMAEWRVLGAVSDVAQAYDWYDRASKLGSAEALRHLTRLDQARRSGSGPASRSDLSRQ
jgi:tetratricopeptide (TPR) repeat protein